MNRSSLQQLHSVKFSEIVLADIPLDIGGRKCDGVSNFVCVLSEAFDGPVGIDVWAHNF